ncbi:MAG: hypothetical protein K6C40_15785 [Thermoguttaceae bacterium]|nr:hypothetical protein [Thermoguttaceae bacterium]
MIDKFGDWAAGPLHGVLRNKLMKGEIHSNPRLNEFMARGDFNGDGKLDWGDVQAGVGHVVDHVDKALDFAGDVISHGLDILISIF